MQTGVSGEPILRRSFMKSGAGVRNVKRRGMSRISYVLDDPWDVQEAGFPSDAMPEDQIRFLLNYAVLAPSAHNTQPWLFRPSGDEVALLADRTRALPVSDPEDRELIMSCGAALFNLRVAIRHFGYSGEVRAFSDLRDPDLLAFVRMGRRTAEADPISDLFPCLSRRRTYRFPFEDRPVETGFSEALSRAASDEGCTLTVFEDPASKNALADLIAEGDKIQGADRSFRRELASWIHPNRSHSRDGIPGYGMGLGDLKSLTGPFVVRTFDKGRGRAARDRELAEGSPLLAVLSTAADNPASWLKAGQAMERVLLAACAGGLYASFLNQPIECPALRPRVEEITGKGVPQIILRLGPGRMVRCSPRRSVMDVLART